MDRIGPPTSFWTSFIILKFQSSISKSTLKFVKSIQTQTPGQLTRLLEVRLVLPRRPQPPYRRVLQGARMLAQRRIGYPAEMQRGRVRGFVQATGDGHVARMVHHVAVLTHQRRRVHAHVVLAEQGLAVLSRRSLLYMMALNSGRGCMGMV